MRVVCMAAAPIVAAGLFVSASRAAPAVTAACASGFAPQGGPTELRGTVTRAEGQVVWIEMESEMWPRVGDAVKLEQMVAGTSLAMGGAWVVAEVTTEFVRAEPGPDARGNPARDYTAVITSANPQPRPAATGTGSGTGGGSGGTGGGATRGGGGADPINLDEAAAIYNSLLGSISDEPTRDEVLARANAGDPWAQTQMGVWYYDGDGVAQSYDEAMRWYRLAADQGSGHAMANLGSMYANGRGVAPDDGEAAAWYRRAADVGIARGQRMLGYFYQMGRGVGKDLAEAVRLYRLAADQGFADAHNDLGVMYEQGWGVEQDLTQAMRWYRSAAELGNHWGYVNLAENYEAGRGVAPDRDLAIENYKAGARLGNTKAQDWLRREGIDWRQ